MRADAAERYREQPGWVENALIIRCAHCLDRPGSGFNDGSGMCEACKGAAWLVLATRHPAPSPTPEESE